ncbi:hypothetical protein ACJW30_11G022700 [Castanea mollissima]
MGSLCSRNTEVINESNETMVVKVIWDPGNSEDKDLERIIPAGGHKYMCYNDIGIENNRYRDVTVRVYVGDEQKLQTSASTIRNSGKIVLRYSNGTVTPTYIDMNMVARIGLIIKIKGATKKIKKLLGKQMEKR